MRRPLLAIPLLGLTAVLGAQDRPRVLLPQGAATVEGDWSTSYPWARVSPCRSMLAYGADMLASTEPMRITGLAFRRDAAVAQHGAARFDVRIDLSTGRKPADNLDRTFDNNHGADRTTVFDATLDIPAASGGSAPHDFSIRVDFTKPFRWDPACGPLVIDLRSPGLASGQLIGVTDGTSTASGTFGRILHTSDHLASQANFPTTGGTQRFVPVVSLLVNAATVPASVAGSDANSSSSYPWNRPAGTEMRVQQIYDPRATGLRGHHRIESLAWRTDRGAQFPGGRTYSIRVTLSTRSGHIAAGASPRFEDNTGPDATVVFEGDWTPPRTSGTSLSTSPFVQRLQLQRPFEYYAAWSALIVDIQLFDVTGPQVGSFDGLLAAGVGVARVFSTSSATAGTGTVQEFALAMRIGTTQARVLPEAFDDVTGTFSGYGGLWHSEASQRYLCAYGGETLATCQPILIERLSWMHWKLSEPVAYQATIDLSTGRVPANALSTRFDLNHGSDRSRAFSGRISVARPSLGTMKFDLQVELDRPFLWDPANGPLIVDIRSLGSRVVEDPFAATAVVKNAGATMVGHRSDPDAFNANDGPKDFAFALRIDADACGAQTIPFGDGCPTSNGPVPLNTVARMPQTGQLEFAFELRHGPRNQQVALLTGTARQKTNLSFVGLPACDLEILPDFIVLTTLTDGAGQARFPWPVPLEPTFHGVTLFTQWLCLDNAAPGGATVSGGLELVFCHQP